MASPIVKTTQEAHLGVAKCTPSAFELRLRQCLAGGGEPAHELKRALLALNGKLLGCRQKAAVGGATVRTHHGVVIERLIAELE